jgi:transcriptional regulator with XRE-family HTH domain
MKRYLGGDVDKNVKRLVQMVADRREIEGLSLRKLAEIVGVSFATLSRLENDTTEPDEGTKARLANWLGKDAGKAGIEIEQVAEVHFRAAKNVDSETVSALLKLAEHLKASANG